MSQQRQYTEVSGGSNNERWEPQKSNMPINPQAPPMLEGYYKKMREQTGSNGVFNVHEIATVNPDGSLGNEFDVSGGVALDDMLEKIAMGSFICVQYLGKVASKTPGRSYNNWKVFKDDNAIPYSRLAPQQMQQASTNAPVYNNQAPVNNGQQFPNQNQQFPQQGMTQQNQQFPNQGQQFPQQGQQFPNQNQQQQFPNQGMGAAPIQTGNGNMNPNGNPFNDDLPF